MAGGVVTVLKISAGRETSGIRGISERQTENLQENTGKTRSRRKESRKDHRTAKRAGGRTSADRAGTGGV